MSFFFLRCCGGCCSHLPPVPRMAEPDPKRARPPIALPVPRHLAALSQRIDASPVRDVPTLPASFRQSVPSRQKRERHKSSPWTKIDGQYFKLDIENSAATCIQCSTVLSYSGSCTSGLRRHYASQHESIFQEVVGNQDDDQLKLDQMAFPFTQGSTKYKARRG